MKTLLKIISIFIFISSVINCSSMKKPEACMSAPTSGTVNTPISFSSSCCSNASKYKWDFGDSTATTTEANPTHTYTKTGTFTCKLMAMSSDESMMSETSKSIQIK